MLASDDPLQQDLHRLGQVREVPVILDTCRAATGMGFNAVARVTEARWINCASLDYLGLGLRPGDELDASSTICHDVRARRATIAIPDVDASDIYRDHDMPRQYGLKSYISVPIIRTNGNVWGTLCAVDFAPRPISAATLSTFELFAKLISLNLDRQDELEAVHLALTKDHAFTRFREDLIAVVGHELSNPIAAVSAGLSILSREGVTEKQTKHLVPEMRRSANRTSQIVTNLADFARVRFASGTQISAFRSVLLEPIFRDVVREFRQIAAQPIDFLIDLPAPIQADPQRLRQLLSNLLDNAMTHGDPREPISVEARSHGSKLQVSVTIQGDPIPSHVKASLLRPFSRGGNPNSLQDLGLGLYIASEIAHAHGGNITVSSSIIEGTTFKFTMPAHFM